MKKRMMIGMVVSAVFLLLGTLSHAQIDSHLTDVTAAIVSDTTDALLLAHHVGNAPFWVGPEDMEDWNVHGGEWDPDLDPNGEDRPAGVPENRPIDDPSSGSSVTNRNNSGTATQSGRSN